MIEEQGVDLLLVQESYPHDEHLPPLLYPDPRRQSLWEMVEQNGWGSAIYSSSGTLKQISVPGFAGWIVGAEICGANWQISQSDTTLVFSIHAPSRGESYSNQVNKLLVELVRIANGREIIVGGDFNLTVSNSVESERSVKQRDLAIQAKLTE